MWKEIGVNFRFFFQQRLDSKKKMEESQKWKNMTSMCFFQQAKNHRKRILKFYKTDLGSSQSIKNFLTHTWKMKKYKIYTADFPIAFHSASAWLAMEPCAHLKVGIILLMWSEKIDLSQLFRGIAILPKSNIK